MKITTVLDEGLGHSSHVVDFGGGQVLVIDPGAAGRVPGAVHAELGALDTAQIPGGPVTVMCGHGERAMTAASQLDAQGDLTVLAGGPEDWSTRTGVPLEVGS